MGSKEIKIYLDYNSTTPLDPRVVEVMTAAMVNCWANPSSSSDLGRKAKSAIEKARSDVAQMIGANQEEIIFTSGGTEASNMIIRSVVEEFESSLDLKPHLVTTTVEHDATSQLLKKLTKDQKIDVTYVQLNKNGTLSANKILEAVTERTCLVTVMLANNETGIIFPVEEIGREIQLINQKREKSLRIFLHTDAAQAIGKIPVCVTNLNVDYVTIVGHKFYGPRIGCVYCRAGCPLRPLVFGGGQENGFRSGTENTSCIAGLGEAAKIVYEEIDKYQSQQMNLRNYLEKKLKESLGDFGVKVNFSEIEARLPNTVSVSFFGQNGREILKKCKRVVASTGAACHAGRLQPSGVLLQLLTYEEALGTIRLSVGKGTTLDDIDASVEDFSKALSLISNN